MSKRTEPTGASQVCLLLHVCRLLVPFLWSRGTDPDSAAIPYLTALGDLLGGGLLALAFVLLTLAGPFLSKGAILTWAGGGGQ